MADGVDILAEVRSVNHRFLECTVRLPRAYGFLEERVKKCVQQTAARGKIEVNLTIQLPSSADSTVAVNLEMANAYCLALREANKTLQLQDDLTLSTLLRLPDVCTVQKLPMEEDVIWQETEVALQEGLTAVPDHATDRRGKAAAGCAASLAKNYGKPNDYRSSSPRHAAEIL